MATDTSIRGFQPMAPKRARSAFVWAYLIALGATAAACGLTWLLPDHRPFFLFFVAAAGLSAWYGGWLPGLISVALGALASAYFFMAPAGSMAVLGPLDQIRLALFTIFGVFIVWLFSILRAAQIALRESEERYRTTLSSIGDAVIATDAHGRVQFLNAVAQELTGWRQQEAVQRPVMEVFRVARETGDSLADPVRRVLESSAPADLKEDTVLLTRDGRQIPIDDSAAPIRNDSGELIGVVLVFRGVRSRCRDEEALRSSEKLAATGRLAASIAHEINNPMEAVGNLLYLLEHHTGLDETAREYTRLAEQELGRMDKIVKQTLGFYRESAEPVPLRLTTVVDNVLELYARQIQKARVQVRKRYRFDGEVRGFPGEMRQVFSNLIANALDAVGQGGNISVHITRSCDWAGPPRPGVRVAIADNGSGIARENLHRIFEPFFTTKGVNGTGLGLWVTYGIVRKHGGRIHVRSSTSGAHCGTCFSVFLPDTMPVSESPTASADAASVKEAA